MLADRRAIFQHEWSALQCRRISTEFAADDLDMITVGHEADVLAFDLFGDHLEPQPVCDRARLCLRLVADGQQQPAHDITRDAPQEVRLVLGVIQSTIQVAVDGARVVTRRDPVALERLGLAHQVAELRERVAAHAGNRRAAAAVLVHEILHHVAPERALQIEHVVRHAK